MRSETMWFRSWAQDINDFERLQTDLNSDNRMARPSGCGGDHANSAGYKLAARTQAALHGKQTCVQPLGPPFACKAL
jgi:hypothetical protein